MYRLNTLNCNNWQVTEVFKGGYSEALGYCMSARCTARNQGVKNIIWVLLDPSLKEIKRWHV